LQTLNWFSCYVIVSMLWLFSEKLFFLFGSHCFVIPIQILLQTLKRLECSVRTSVSTIVEFGKLWSRVGQPTKVILRMLVGLWRQDLDCIATYESHANSPKSVVFLVMNVRFILSLIHGSLCIVHVSPCNINLCQCIGLLSTRFNV
jgi:hypothetical protein